MESNIVEFSGCAFPAYAGVSHPHSKNVYLKGAKKMTGLIIIVAAAGTLTGLAIWGTTYAAAHGRLKLNGWSGFALAKPWPYLPHGRRLTAPRYRGPRSHCA